MRKTIKRQVSYRVGEYSYQGATITAAKQAAKDHHEWLMNDDGFTPQTITWRGEILLLFRGRFSWEYRILKAGERELTEGVPSPVWGNSSAGGECKKASWQAALRHLAQVTWVHEDGAEESAVPPFLTDEKNREEFLSWCRFQVSYQELRTQGYTDHEAHAMAFGWKIDAAGRTVPA